MPNKIALLLLNGNAPEKITNPQDYEIFIATDGAIQKAIHLGVIPDFVLGDFDSIDNELAKNLNVNFVRAPDQNFTDFEKSLAFIHEKGFEEVHIYGASGGEQDHFLGNLSAALAWKSKIKLTFFDKYGTYYFLKKSEQNRINEVKGKTISLLPLPNADQVSTSGLEFPLQKEDLNFGKRIGTRNFAIESEIEIHFTEGNLLIFINDRET
jgi:thiamine pyrophosphokinase